VAAVGPGWEPKWGPGEARRPARTPRKAPAAQGDPGKDNGQTEGKKRPKEVTPKCGLYTVNSVLNSDMDKENEHTLAREVQGPGVNTPPLGEYPRAGMGSGACPGPTSGP
jgi:hypothetical protein